MVQAHIILQDDARITRQLEATTYMNEQEGTFTTAFIDGDLYYVVRPSALKEGTLDEVRSLAGDISRHAQQAKIERVTTTQQVVDTLVNDATTAFVEGFHLGAYAFDKYKSKKANPVAQLIIEGADAEAVSLGKTRADAMALARDLMNEVSDHLNPEYYAEWMTEHFASTNVDVTILDRDALIEHEMNGVLTVGQGSKYEQRFAELRLANNPSKPLVALVGKGVTFDTGGISLKSGADLSDMRMDMGGSAAVVGAMHLLAETNADVNVIGLIPMVENAPDNTSVYPGEIITYKNGTTVQVGNTDAEGRLILADALLRADELGAEYVVDIATLTGAIHNALGTDIAGVFGNDESLAFEMKKIGDENGDFNWPMPLVQSYNRGLKSDYADLNNISNLGFAGSITAGLFLQHFVKPETKWLHVDMAGTMEAPAAKGYYAKSATGFGARLLADYAMNISK